jgi:hypothetical protein
MGGGEREWERVLVSYNAAGGDVASEQKGGHSSTVMAGLAHAYKANIQL